jgi:hypothetical protein
MRRIATGLSFGLVILALAATSAFALSSGAHYNTEPTLVVSNNALTVSGTAAGLGNIGSVDITLTGSVTVDARCYTKSQNKPQAANKQETTDVNLGGPFPTSKNGSVSFSFTVSPLSTLSCPKGQIVTIESISYNLTLNFPSYSDLNRTFTSS